MFYFGSLGVAEPDFLGLVLTENSCYHFVYMSYAGCFLHQQTVGYILNLSCRKLNRKEG